VVNHGDCVVLGARDDIGFVVGASDSQMDELALVVQGDVSLIDPVVTDFLD